LCTRIYRVNPKIQQATSDVVSANDTASQFMQTHRTWLLEKPLDSQLFKQHCSSPSHQNKTVQQFH